MQKKEIITVSEEWTLNIHWANEIKLSLRRSNIPTIKTYKLRSISGPLVPHRWPFKDDSRIDETFFRFSMELTSWSVGIFKRILKPIQFHPSTGAKWEAEQWISLNVTWTNRILHILWKFAKHAPATIQTNKMGTKNMHIFVVNCGLAAC